MIHSFLTQAYLAKGRAVENIQKTIDNLLCLL